LDIWGKAGEAVIPTQPRKNEQIHRKPDGQAGQHRFPDTSHFSKRENQPHKKALLIVDNLWITPQPKNNLLYAAQRDQVWYTLH
jgi:hypothetical protein